MELEVFKIDGKKTDRKVQLDESVFGIKPNDHAIYLDVKQILANARQGTHSSTEKGDITGSTRKIKRQKGTGTARAGSIKSPIFRGGGRVFGPLPRDYGFKVNKKVKQLARISALSYKAIDNEIMVLEDFDFDSPRTRNFADLLRIFELDDKKTLFVFPHPDRNIILSSRNLQKVKVIRPSDLNTYDILNYNRICLSESSVKEIEKIFKKS